MQRYLHEYERKGYCPQSGRWSFLQALFSLAQFLFFRKSSPWYLDFMKKDAVQNSVRGVVLYHGWNEEFVDLLPCCGSVQWTSEDVKHFPNTFLARSKKKSFSSFAFSRSPRLAQQGIICTAFIVYAFSLHTWRNMWGVLGYIFLDPRIWKL